MRQCHLGFEKLNADEKYVYERLLDALLSFSDVVDGNRFNRKVDLMKVLNVVVGDNPGIIHFNKSQIKLTDSMFGGRQIRLCGTYSKSRINQMYAELNAALERAVSEIELLNPMTKYDKLMCIYEYLQDHVVYDDRELEATCRSGSIRDPLSHNAYGALINGRAVCDGVVSAFSLLAQKMNIESTMVAGSAKFCTANFSAHAWNLIRVDGKCYHLDATWDINRKGNTGEYSYDYFCVDDDLIASDHHWDITSSPVCKSLDLAFHFRNKCYANSLAEVSDIFLRYARSKQRSVRVRIREGIAVPEPCLQTLGQMLMDAAGVAGRYSPFEYYWDDDTRCFFARFTQ